MRKLLIALAVVTLSLGTGTLALAGNGPVGPIGPIDCPDHDGDGVCNGQDPDYVPGGHCPEGDCPNPDCPDADGDGVCNGQDPDYVPPCDGPNRHGRHWLESMVNTIYGLFGLAF